jgi:hypothetical protein
LERKIRFRKISRTGNWYFSFNFPFVHCKEHKVADIAYIERVKQCLASISKIASVMQVILGCSPREILLLGFGLFAILILLVIFVFWGFQQFSRQSIGLTLLQSVKCKSKVC